ncbi:MAG TPA: FtsQ-type POTRA domain-containing protein [Thermoanaerobaculia bacterium]|nr:FtsQ-type POTRA domain-containing protein [Thermoanaerobaculia bacterium]
MTGFLRPGIARASRPSRKWTAAFWLLVAGAGAVGIGRYLRSPAFLLERFEVEGTRRARTREVLEALAPYEGRNLLLLNLAPVARAVGGVAWVERVTVSKELPHALRIAITEKTPIAFCRRGTALYWMDARGVVVAPFDPRESAGDFPIVSAPDARLADAAALLTALQRRFPEYASTVSEIQALSSGGFGIMDGTLRVPIEVLGSDAPEKIRALFSLKPEMDSRGIVPKAIDLRFDRRVVFSGAFSQRKTV